MDQTLQCVDCGADFIYTEKDQEFYREKGFEPPKRCKMCRILKKKRNIKNGQNDF